MTDDVDDRMEESQGDGAFMSSFMDNSVFGGF